MKLSPNVMEYEDLQRKEVLKSSACLENEPDAWKKIETKLSLTTG